MSPACALHVMERLLHVMTHGHFINLLASAVVLNDPEPSVAVFPPRSSPSRLSIENASAEASPSGLLVRIYRTIPSAYLAVLDYYVVMAKAHLYAGDEWLEHFGRAPAEHA